jgi:hypothetical protein
MQNDASWSMLVLEVLYRVGKTQERKDLKGPLLLPCYPTLLYPTLPGKAKLRIQNEKYLREHPEAKKLVSPLIPFIIIQGDGCMYIYIYMARKEHE